jgi:hypothetical protein
MRYQVADSVTANAVTYTAAGNVNLVMRYFSRTQSNKLNMQADSGYWPEVVIEPASHQD